MKKDYYIQGDPAKAEQIKAAFQELGINVLDFGFADKTVVYCSIGECVQYLPYSINLMNILYSHPDYQELELSTKPKFKVGDWITNDTWTHCIQSISDGFYHFLEGGRLDFGKIDGYYRLWEISDASNGDVLVVNGSSKEYKWIGIFKAHTSDTSFSSYCHYNCGMCEFVTDIARCTKHGIKYNDIRPATNEERGILFAKMREAGYTWDENKKELKKLKHYDISSFHAGMPVLVRDTNDDEWNYLYFSHYRKKMPDHFFAGGNPWSQCIPFEGNETLLGTTDMCNEQYINW